MPLAYDRALCADVLGAFVGALQRSLRWRAKRALGLRSVDGAESGAVTFVQRCDSSLRLNVHFHTLALDGVYVREQSGALSFHRLPDPTHEEVVQVATWVHERLARVLARHGRSLVRVVREVVPPGEALADVGGVNVHSGAAIDGRDRKRLERLCRYIARPPLAQERLEEHGDGRLPRFHMLRYHGVLAAHAKARAEVVPGRAASAASEPVQLGLGFEAASASEPSAASEPASTSDRPSRHPWA